jgi:hypothetical protein
MRSKLLSLFLIISNWGFSQQIIDTTRIYGVTIDAVTNLNQITASLSKLCKKATTRIVFDEFVAATYYSPAIDSIRKVSFIMGELLDSYYVKQYTVPAYTSRATEYLNAFQNKVNIWEVGNEINGEWLGPTDSVVAKMKGAYDLVKARGKKTELTLYYNENCWAKKANEMFTWANANIPTAMKTGLDYVLVSYYEDDCNGLQPKWQQAFDSLRKIFPNSKLGIGECGTLTAANKASYINRYYQMNITTPGYIGGYFWWYYKQDCVPYTNPLWSVLNTNLCSQTTSTGSFPGTQKDNCSIYPNPFNANFTLRISADVNLAKVELRIIDLCGKEVKSVLMSSYETTVSRDELQSGIYFYNIINNNESIGKGKLIVQ